MTTCSIRHEEVNVLRQKDDCIREQFGITAHTAVAQVNLQLQAWNPSSYDDQMSACHCAAAGVPEKTSATRVDVESDLVKPNTSVPFARRPQRHRHLACNAYKLRIHSQSPERAPACYATLNVCGFHVGAASYLESPRSVHFSCQTASGVVGFPLWRLPCLLKTVITGQTRLV